MRVRPIGLQGATHSGRVGVVRMLAGVSGALGQRASGRGRVSAAKATDLGLMLSKTGR